MTTTKYLKVSPAQAVWANQSGKVVLKKQEEQFVPVSSKKELQQNQPYYITLRPDQVANETDITSRYQSLMTLFSLANLVSFIIIAFNYDSDINTLMISLGFIWLFSAKNIIFKTITFNKERSIRKAYYLYGRIYH